MCICVCRNQLITDAAYSFGDQLLNADIGERVVLVKQQPKEVSLPYYVLVFIRTSIIMCNNSFDSKSRYMCPLEPYY